MKHTEGWTYLLNSPKWHYFREGRALCGRFLLLGNPELEQGNEASADNCSSCRRKLEKERAKRAAIPPELDRMVDAVLAYRPEKAKGA